MANTIQFIFGEVPSPSGLIYAVVERPLNNLEKKAAGNAVVEKVYLSSALVNNYDDLEDDEQMESDDGGTRAGEISLSLSDTFGDHLLDFRGKTPSHLGLASFSAVDKPIRQVLSEQYDFSLFMLLLCKDPEEYFKNKNFVIEEDVSITFYINGIKERKVVLNYAATSFDGKMLYGKSKSGTWNIYQKNYWDYKGSQKVLKLTGYDYTKYVLENLSISDLDLPADTPLTNWITGDATDATESDTEAAWHGIGIRALMREIGDRAFFPLDVYNGNVSAIRAALRSKYWSWFSDNSPFWFVPSSIPTENFIALGSGYAPYLYRRYYDHGATTPTSHHLTKYFNILDSSTIDPESKAVATADEVYLDRSFLRDFTEIYNYDAPNFNKFANSPEDLNDKEFCFTRYESLYQVRSRIAQGMGYFTRDFYSDGKPSVLHLAKTRDMYMITIPAHLKDGLQGEPFGASYDFVSVSPVAKFGKQCPFRLIANGETWDNRPPQLENYWSKYAELHEPANDISKFTVKWKNVNWDYYHQDEVDLEQNEPRVSPVLFPKTALHYGRNTLNTMKTFETKVFYGLFGSLCVCLLGCEYQDGVPRHSTFIGFEGGIYNHMGNGDEEFGWIPIGHKTEYMLPNRAVQGDDSKDKYQIFSSGYPGLILFAGYSSDKGKTINASLTGQPAFYRGASKIFIPVGDKKANGYFDRVGLDSSLRTHAVYEGQFRVGSNGRFVLKIGSLSSFENSLGYVGYRSVFCGLGLEIFSRKFRVVHVLKRPRLDTVEMTVEELPSNQEIGNALAPELFSLTLPTRINSRGVYNPFGAEYYRIGSGGDKHELEYNKKLNGT